MTNEFRPIPGWPGYSISRAGVVMGVCGFPLAAKNGRVSLNLKGRTGRFLVAALVAQAFAEQAAPEPAEPEPTSTPVHMPPAAFGYEELEDALDFVEPEEAPEAPAAAPEPLPSPEPLPEVAAACESCPPPRVLEPAPKYPPAKWQEGGMEAVRRRHEAKVNELLRENDQLKFTIRKLTKQRDNLAAKRLLAVAGGNHEKR